MPRRNLTKIPDPLRKGKKNDCVIQNIETDTCHKYSGRKHGRVIEKRKGNEKLATR